MLADSLLGGLLLVITLIPLLALAGLVFYQFIKAKPAGSYLEVVLCVLASVTAAYTIFLYMKKPGPFGEFASVIGILASFAIFLGLAKYLYGFIRGGHFRIPILSYTLANLILGIYISISLYIVVTDAVRTKERTKEANAPNRYDEMAKVHSLRMLGDMIDECGKLANPTGAKVLEAMNHFIDSRGAYYGPAAINKHVVVDPRFLHANKLPLIEDLHKTVALGYYECLVFISDYDDDTQNVLIAITIKLKGQDGIGEYFTSYGLYDKKLFVRAK